MDEMKQICDKHKNIEIEALTGAHKNTVTNWKKTGNMAVKFLSKLGWRIVRKDSKLYTSDEVKDILDDFKNNRTFGIKVEKKSAGVK